MALNTPKRIELLSQAIDLANSGSPADFDAWHTKTRTSIRLALGPEHQLLSEFDEVVYHPSAWAYDGSDASRRRNEQAFAERRRTGVRQVIAILQSGIDEITLLAEPESAAPADGLHPLVAASVGQLLDDGYNRQAVESAARAVEQQVRAKVMASGGTGPQLADAFSPKPPKASEARLRFAEFDEGSDSWTNAHVGALHFAKGCFMRIRNLHLHHTEPTRAEAHEAVAAFSLLARWVDDAIPVFADES